MRPEKISKELSKFTGWKADDLKSRVDLNRFLSTYIKENNLKDETNKAIIKPDAKLKKLLGYEETDGDLKWGTMQRYIQKHFIKEVKEEKKI